MGCRLSSEVKSLHAKNSALVEQAAQLALRVDILERERQEHLADAGASDLKCQLLLDTIENYKSQAEGGQRLIQELECERDGFRMRMLEAQMVLDTTRAALEAAEQNCSLLRTRMTELQMEQTSWVAVEAQISDALQQQHEPAAPNPDIIRRLPLSPKKNLSVLPSQQHSSPPKSSATVNRNLVKGSLPSARRSVSPPSSPKSPRGSLPSVQPPSPTKSPKGSLPTARPPFSNITPVVRTPPSSEKSPRLHLSSAKSPLAPQPKASTPIVPPSPTCRPLPRPPCRTSFKSELLCPNGCAIPVQC